MEGPVYTNVKQALITSAEALLFDHSAIRTEEDVISTKINQHGSKKEQLEFKANSLNESMKTIKSSLDETWKNTTSLQYGTVVHVASLKKYSESTDEHKKEYMSFDQEFQTVSERMNQLNNQFIEFSLAMSVEEKKKSELSKAVKSAVQSKQAIDKSIEAGGQRLLDTDKALSEMNINLSVTLNELQTKEGLLQSTTFETKQQEENEKTIKSEIQLTTEKIEKDSNLLNDLSQRIEQVRNDKVTSDSNLDRAGKDAFNEVIKTVENDIEQINHDVEQCKSTMSNVQDDLQTTEGVVSQTKKTLLGQQHAVVERKKDLKQLEKSLEAKLLEKSQHQNHIESLRKDVANISKSIEKSNEELSSKMDHFKLVTEESPELISVKKDHQTANEKLTRIKESLQEKKDNINSHCKRAVEIKSIIAQNGSKSSNLNSELSQYSTQLTEMETIEQDIQKQIRNFEQASKEYDTRLLKAEEKLGESVKYSEGKKKMDLQLSTLQKEIEQRKKELEETNSKQHKTRMEQMLLEAEQEEDEAEETLRQLLITHDKERKMRANKIQELKLNAEKAKKRKAINLEESTPKKKKKSSSNFSLDDDNIFSVSSQSSDAPRTYSKTSKKEKQPKPKKTKETNLSPPSSTAKGRRKSQTTTVTETKPKQVESTGKKTKTSPSSSSSSSKQKKKSQSLNNSQLSVFDFTD